MKNIQKNAGFTLISAMFLLVVIAGLMVYMVNISSVQRATLVYAVQGARAMQAARSGIEWGIYQALNVTASGVCPADKSFNLNDSALSGFDIEVTCSVTQHIEGVIVISSYRLTSVAQMGTYGSLDYVQRRIQATVSEDPP